MTTNRQRINELDDIIQHSPLLNPSIKSVSETSPLFRGGERIINDLPDVRASTEMHSKHALTPTMPKRKPNDEFISLHMSYGAIFEYLHFRKLLYRIESSLDPKEDIKGPNWKKNAHCKYHRGN